jgi:hypothetical protein
VIHYKTATCLSFYSVIWLFDYRIGQLRYWVINKQKQEII